MGDTLDEIKIEELREEIETFKMERDALRLKIAAAIEVISGDNEWNAFGACLRAVEILSA